MVTKKDEYYWSINFHHIDKRQKYLGSSYYKSRIFTNLDETATDFVNYAGEIIQALDLPAFEEADIYKNNEFLRNYSLTGTWCLLKECLNVRIFYLLKLKNIINDN